MARGHSPNEAQICVVCAVSSATGQHPQSALLPLKPASGVRAHSEEAAAEAGA